VHGGRHNGREVRLEELAAMLGDLEVLALAFVVFGYVLLPVWVVRRARVVSVFERID